MKTLAILFTLFYFLNALAVAPYGFKGQSQSQTLYSNVLQAPNQLVTNLGGINALMETGNKNILANPSFEAPLVSSAAPSWSSLGFLTNNITPPVSGQKAVQVSMTASALSLHQDSGVNNNAYGDGLQCLASVYVKTSLSGIFVSPRLNNVTSTSNMVSVVPNGKWALYKVPFICSTGANGIAIHSNGVAVTGTVDVDDAFVAAVDLQASNDASKIAGESYFAFGGSYTTTSFASASGTRSPTIVIQNEGSWQTSALAGYQQTVNNLPPGCYSYTWTFGANGSNIGATQQFAAAVNGTTQTATQTYFLQGSSMGSGMSVKGSHCITTSQNITYELRGASTAGSVGMNQGVVNFNLLKFSSGSTYSSTNADTDWASCTPSSSQGFGTPTFAIQCKRQGGDLLMKGTFTPSTTTAVEARLGLPLWNGVQLNSASSLIIPAIQQNGNGSLSTATAGQIITLIEPSVSYITFGFQTSGAAGLTKATGSTLLATGSLSLHARIPIEGWQGSNIIVGSFSGLQSCTSTLACTDTFSAAVSSAGVVLNENVDWINGNCTTAVSGINTDYTCSYVSGLVTQPMNCVSVDTSSATNPNATRIFTSTSSQFQGSNATGRGITVVCQKQGADYVGKTALAVASDQNVRAIGSTGVDIQSVYFGSSADCTTACTTGNCTICSQVGSKITSVQAFNTTGNYRLNGIDGTKYICSGTGLGSSGTIINHRRASSTSTYANMQSWIGGTGSPSGESTITCVGIP